MVYIKSSIFQRIKMCSFHGVQNNIDHEIERKSKIRYLVYCWYIQKSHLLITIKQLASHALQVIGYIRQVSNGRLSYVRCKLEFASDMESTIHSIRTNGRDGYEWSHQKRKAKRYGRKLKHYPFAI